MMKREEHWKLPGLAKKIPLTPNLSRKLKNLDKPEENLLNNVQD